jgi:hypothetical protein
VLPLAWATPVACEITGNKTVGNPVGVVEIRQPKTGENCWRNSPLPFAGQPRWGWICPCIAKLIMVKRVTNLFLVSHKATGNIRPSLAGVTGGIRPSLAGDAGGIRSAGILACLLRAASSGVTGGISRCRTLRCHSYCNAAGAALKKQTGMSALRMPPVPPERFSHAMTRRREGAETFIEEHAF